MKIAKSAVFLRAKLVSLHRRMPLPPGGMSPSLDALETADRFSLIRISETKGPVFKGQAWGAFWIYVIGLPRCRRVMREHEALMRPATIDTSAIFAAGLMRQMEGEVHSRYRSQLVQALTLTDFESGIATFENETSQQLASLAAEFGARPVPFQNLYHCLAELVFRAFLKMIFGMDRTTANARAMRDAYQQMGGNGLVWSPGERQKQAVERIADLLRNSSGTIHANSLLGQMGARGEVDHTLLCNVIYMVEMGRYDTTAFLRWLMWFAAMHPDWVDRVASDPDAERIAAAFVMEVLRLEQAERLVRRVKQDFVAEGFLFPKGAMVRFCIWESHKLPEAHERPFEFDPTRFLVAKRPGPDRYSPFGTDRHQCPFGAFSIQFGSAFLKALARSFRLSAEGAAGSVRGLYHWEPKQGFCPVITPRHAEAVQ